MSDGTGMTPPPASEAAGAVTSREATRKNPSQGNFRSGIKIDTNKHGIRREVNNTPKKRSGRPKKV